jgi:hypothetical protein
MWSSRTKWLDQVANSVHGIAYEVAELGPRHQSDAEEKDAARSQQKLRGLATLSVNPICVRLVHKRQSDVHVGMRYHDRECRSN